MKGGSGYILLSACMMGMGIMTTAAGLIAEPFEYRKKCRLREEKYSKYLTDKENAVKKAKEMGLQVVAVDINPEAIGFKEEGIIKEVISTIDIPKVVKAAKRNKLDCIMALASDMPMRSVAAVAKELGLVGISEDTALKATNKAVMRQALYEYGVPVPHFYKVSSKEDILNFNELIKFKIV